MSSLLGALPPLHGRRSPSLAQSLAPPPATTLHQPHSKPSPNPPSPPAPIHPLRLALRFSPPLLALEFEHRRSGNANPTRRAREFHVNLQAKTAKDLAGELQREYPQYLGPALVTMGQLQGLMERLLEAQDQVGGVLEGTELLRMDLNKVDPAVLDAAKKEMGKSFSARVLRPGDVGYEYDKQVEYDDPTEPSDWD